MLPGLPTAAAVLPILALTARARSTQAALWAAAGLCAALGTGGVDAWAGPLRFALDGALAVPLGAALLAHAALADRTAGPTLAAVALALTAQDPRLGAAGVAAAGLLGVAGAGPVRRGVVALGAIALLGGGAWLVAAGEHPRVVIQLRALAVWGGGAVLAVAGGVRRDAPWTSALAALAAGGALARSVLPAVPDGWQVAGVGVAWAAAGLPWLALATGRPALVAALAPLGAALLGWLTGTAAGVAGAALALSGIALAAAVSRSTPAPGERPWPARAVVAGALALPGGPGFAGAALALGAAVTALGPVDLQLPAGLCAVGLLVGAGWSLWGPAPSAAPGRGTWIVLALALALGGGALLARGPLTAAAVSAAQVLSEPRLPAGDVGGHRRLWRLQQRRLYGSPRDAGP